MLESFRPDARIVHLAYSLLAALVGYSLMAFILSVFAKRQNWQRCQYCSWYPFAFALACSFIMHYFIDFNPWTTVP